MSKEPIPEITFIREIRQALCEPRMFWLNLSILIFVAILPFNHYGLKIFSTDYSRVKYTEIAMIFIAVFALIAYRRGVIALRRDFIFYAFLILHILANFLSLINSPLPKTSLILATSMSFYSVLVFVLINVLRSEALLRAILCVMGIVSLSFITDTFIVYLLNGGFYYTGTQFTILGNTLSHYIAYVLIVYGTGLLYLLFNEKHDRVRLFFMFYAILWLFVAMLPNTKVSQAITLTLLIFLWIFIWQKRKTIFLLIIVFILSFLFNMNIVSIRNGISEISYSLRSKYPLLDAVAQKADAKMEKMRAISLGKKAKPIEVAPDIGEVADIAKMDKINAYLRSWPESAERLSSKRAGGAAPVLLDEYSEINNFRKRWSGRARQDSIDLRIRGVVAGWYMGCVFPWTGIGAGHTALFFDNFSKFVQEKSNDPSYLPNLPFREYIFTDTDYTVEFGASIFNIFINAWAETGALGLLAIVGILLCITIRGFCAYRKPEYLNEIRTLNYYLPLFLAITLYHQINYFWAHPWPWTVYCLAYAAADTSVNNKHKGDRYER